MKRKRRISYCNLEVTIVEQLKPTKDKPNKRRTTKKKLEKQVVVGSTPLEVMKYDTHLKTKLETLYENPVVIMVNRMEIIYSSTKTQYAI